MKTQATFFALLTAMTLVSGSVFAAGAKDIRARTSIETKEMDQIKAETIASLKGLKTKEALWKKTSEELGRISNGRAEVAELNSAVQRRVLSYTGNDGKYLSLYNVGKNLLKLDQLTREFRLAGNLTAEGKSHLEALENAVSVGTEFLAMASVTSKTSKLASKFTKNDDASENMFNKQLSILMDLGSMDKADLLAHTAVMKAAVSRKTSPKIAGDKAFLIALTLDHAKGDREKAGKVAEDLINCK